MKLICLDLEGVLVPEIWIAVAEKTGLKELRLTTRDISDYDQLMNYRLEILDREKIFLKDIQSVISTLEPLDGARQFVSFLEEHTQFVIISDTFDQFASPLMAKLNHPTLFCNTLNTDQSGKITGYTLRQQDGKKKAVEAFKSMGIKVFASGDSYNDVTMLRSARQSVLFRASETVINDVPEIPAVTTYDELKNHIKTFLADD